MNLSTRLSFASLLCVLTACGSSGSYELRWSIACEGDCEIENVYQCSKVGIDRIEVTATRDSERDVTTFACYGPDDGPVGRGPGLTAGTWQLEVSALSGGGQPISGPISLSAEIPDDGYVSQTVELPKPIACIDGVDNDGDGLVDHLDPGCADAEDDDES